MPAEGLSVRQMADSLGLPRSTVADYIRRLICPFHGVNRTPALSVGKLGIWRPPGGTSNTALVRSKMPFKRSHVRKNGMRFLACRRRTSKTVSSGRSRYSTDTMPLPR